MSITLDVPADLAAQAQRIPDLEGRIALFLRQQLELEAWRASRYPSKIRSLVEAAGAEAVKLRDAGVEREQLFAEFIQLSRDMDSDRHEEGEADPPSRQGKA